MRVLDILRIPLVKFLGICVILYFALFSNKENPESLGNRLSSENMKKNIGEMQEKSRFIIVNVKMAQEAAKEKEAQEKAIAQNLRIMINDLDAGTGEGQAECRDEAEISYSAYDASGKQIEFVTAEKLVIGSKTRPVIEEHITGMKPGGIRNITIPYGYQTTDAALSRSLKFNASDLRYQVTLINLRKAADTTIVCN